MLRHVPRVYVAAAASLLAFPACIACAAAVDDDPGPERPTLVVRGTPELVDPLCAEIREHWGEDLRFEVDCRAPSEQAADGFDLLVVQMPLSGDTETAAENAANTLLRGLPASIDNRLRLGDTVYDAPEHVLAVRRPESEHWLVAGRSTEALRGVVRRLVLQAAGARFWPPQDPFDYLLFETHWSLRSGRWQVAQAAKGEGPATVGLDPNERDDLADRLRDRAARVAIEHPGLVVRVPAPRRAEIAPWSEQMADALGTMAQRLGAQTPPVEILVESDYETQGRHIARLGPAVVHRGPGGQETLHAVVHPPDVEDDLDAMRHELARLLVRRLRAQPNSGDLPPWIEDGAALWLSGGWFGRPWRDWLGDLAACDVLPTAGELLAEDRQRDGSRVLWPPVAAAVIDALPGASLAEKLERSAAELPDAASARAFADRVLTALRDAAPELERAPPRHPEGFEPFHHGVSFAMANGIDSGYHARSAEAQLDRLRGLGVDAVSLMPFAYQRDPKRPGLGFMNESPASETDVGVLHAARRARERGFLVLWKPHLWLGHGSWPGDVEMISEVDWQRWFRGYRRYIVHHAVLAEHAEAEWFSVGVELSLTLSREAEWRELVAAVRRVYRGEVTYAGNWWQGFDQVPFWDDLDAIGVDAYFPLGGADADRAALAEGARRAVEQIRAVQQRWHRPVLLTEVGFAAREGAWVSPHEEGGTVSEADQRLAWDVLLEALGKPEWLRGVYAWKVFTHRQTEASVRPDFQILGREAESVLVQYFRAAETPTRATSQ